MSANITICKLILLIIAICIMALHINNHTISEREHNIIINKHYNGYDDETIAREHNLKPSTIHNYIKRYENTDSILTPYETSKKQAKDNKVPRTKLLDDIQLSNYLTEKCLSDPTTSLHKYSGDVLNEFGIFISKNIVDRYFKSKGWKWKRLSRIAFEVDLDEEHLFWRLMDEIVTDPKQLLFLDESSRCNRTVNPTHGRGPQGRVYVKVSFTRGGYRFSLLMVVEMDGILVFQVYLGSVDTEKFVDFVMTDLAPYFRPYPSPRSVLILDNISFHHDPIFMTLVEMMDVIIVHLPHYLPLYNLAEYGFRDIKAIEKSKRVYGEEEGLLSLVETVDSLKDKSYKPILKKLGYIRE